MLKPAFSLEKSTHSGWCDGVIDPLFREWFIKQQNNWRDGVKVVHGVMAWLALLQGVICETAK